MPPIGVRVNHQRRSPACNPGRCRDKLSGYENPFDRSHWKIGRYAVHNFGCWQLGAKRKYVYVDIAQARLHYNVEVNSNMHVSAAELLVLSKRQQINCALTRNSDYHRLVTWDGTGPNECFEEISPFCLRTGGVQVGRVLNVGFVRLMRQQTFF